jgi:hypothetical protein
MPEPTPQTYANHVRRVPALYTAGAAALALAFVGDLVLLFLYRSPTIVFPLLGLFGAAVALAYARTSAQVVQNRLIRLEERLRLERLLPADLAARIPELTVSQLVALRFAGDGEVADLVRAVFAENLTRRDEIKRRVRDWRADYLRV